MAQTQSLTVVVSEQVDGIDMGVLSDGTPYLTARGLARACGAAPSTIITQASEWVAGKREGKLAKMLSEAGYSGDIYIPIKIGKTTAYAFPDDVCTIVLEYYAYEVGLELAKARFRTLARVTLRNFIYKNTGYTPGPAIPDSWRQFHDRLLINSTPKGYFSVFKEMADMVLSAIQNGLIVDSHTVPDISVGIHWSRHWVDQGFDQRFGERTKYDHNFPEYFPQSVKNPHDSFAYPLAALGEFRLWMSDEYIPKHFPVYLQNKVKRGALAAQASKLILAAYADEPEPEAPTE